MSVYGQILLGVAVIIMETRATLLLINLVMFFIGIDLIIYKGIEKRDERPEQHQIIEVPVEPEPQPDPINYDIDNPIPSYKSYDDVVVQLKEWEQEAPELVEVNIYGKSSKGKDLYYLRINNVRIKTEKPVTLVHATTHGNEPWAGCEVMAYVGTILDKYGDDDQITNLVDSRDMYFIPIVSPDSHPNSRHVDGVDPNRDYPTERSPNKKSVPPIQALREFTLTIKPRAAISGHTWGRVFLYPWGDQNRETPNDADYVRILSEMRKMSGYTIQQANELYNRPIYGGDMDWFHRQGAFSIVIEYGTHQSKPSDAQIKSEFDKTFPAVLHFLEEGPKVDIQQWTTEMWAKYVEEAA